MGKYVNRPENMNVIVAEMADIGILTYNETRDGYYISKKTSSIMNDIAYDHYPLKIADLVDILVEFNVRDQSAVIDYAHVLYQSIKKFERKNDMPNGIMESIKTTKKSHTDEALK